MIKNKYIRKILKYYETLWALEHYRALGEWDQNVYMPEKGTKPRGKAAGKVKVLLQKMFTDKQFLNLISAAEQEKDLTDVERGIIRVLKRELRDYQKLPAEFLEEFERLTTQAYAAWVKAKKQKDFSIFEPYFSKIVEMLKQKVEYIGYKEHPYDVLLDDFEEGLTVKQVDSFFEQIVPEIKELLDYVKRSPHYKDKHPLEFEEYDRDKMYQLNIKILKLLGAPFNRLRLDESPHPFTIGIALGCDVRITTWYHKYDFGRSLTAAIHEYGHALYDLQQDRALRDTPVGGGVSYAVHESQSRFWENIVARSPEFIERILPDIYKFLGSRFEKYDLEDYVGYFNLVRPSLIRVEADEVTYHLHIYLRYKIEKELIEGKIKPKEVRDLWNSMIHKLFGLKVPSDDKGVLQDVHWSLGYIGYFPTYSLGTFMSGLVLSQMQKDLGKLEDLVNPAGFKQVSKWLKEHIHRYGKVYPPAELIKRLTGKRFTPRPFLSYLRKKYKRIY